MWSGQTGLLPALSHVLQVSRLVEELFSRATLGSQSTALPQITVLETLSPVLCKVVHFPSDPWSHSLPLLVLGRNYARSGSPRGSPSSLSENKERRIRVMWVFPTLALHPSVSPTRKATCGFSLPTFSDLIWTQSSNHPLSHCFQRKRKTVLKLWILRIYLMGSVK